MSASTLRSGWRIVRFGDVVSNVNENTKEPSAIGLDRVVGLDHLDPESLPLRRWDYLRDLPDGTSFTRIFRSGQVLFGKRRAYQRKVAVPDFDGICSGDILVFEPAGSDLLPAFLPYLVQSDGFFDHALGTSAGSLSPRTKWQELAKYEFALPPIDEQKRLVEVLECSHHAVERSAEVQQRSIDLAGSLASRLVPRLRDEASGRLGDLCSVQVGYPFSSKRYSDKGVRLLRCSNVAVNYMHWEEQITRYWPDDLVAEFKDYELREGDVVIAMDRPFVTEGFKVARVRKEDLPALLLQRVGRLIPKPGMGNDMLWAILSAPAAPKHLKSLQKGTDLPHVSKFDIESIPVRLEELGESGPLAAINRASVLIEQAEGLVERSTNLHRSLLRELLSVH